MNDFSWVICICDDEPNNTPVRMAKEILSSYFDCQIFSSRDDFSNKSKQYKLMNCNIALIDMQWGGNFPVTSANGQCPCIPENSDFETVRGCNDFISEWITAISAWSSAGEKQPAKLGKWPQNAINNDDVGVWLGAMMSHVAPKAQIIFWSGHSNIFSQGLSAALGRYKHASYEVHTKDQHTGIEVHKIWPYLETLQKRELQNQIVRQWLLKDVLLQLLANQEPNDCVVELFIPASKDYEQRMLKFNNFFPNLKTFGRKQKLGELQKYLSDSLWSSELEKAFIGVAHVLHGLLPNEDALSQTFETITLEKYTDKVRRAFDAAILTGEWGRNILGSILSAQKEIDSNNLTTAKEAILRTHQEVEATLSNARPFLQNVIQKYHGTYTKIHTHNDKFTLGFPLYWIDQSILLHLFENATRKENKFSLALHEMVDSVVIEWKSTWPELNDETSLWQEIASSLAAKKEARGLPLVILRGIEAGAKEFWLKAGRQWRQVWPPQEKSKDEDDEYHFGVRFVFLKRVEGVRR